MRLNRLSFMSPNHSTLTIQSLFTRLLTAVLLTFTLASTPAMATPDYQIEVLIFSNNDDSVLDDEYWESTLDIIPPRRQTKLYSAQSQANDFILSPTAEYQLAAQAKRISRSNKHTLLYHTAWKQKVGTDKNAKSIRVLAGDLMDNGMYELEGYISVSRGRYLHFRPNLFFSKRLSNYQASLIRKPTPEPTPEPTTGQFNEFATNPLATDLAATSDAGSFGLGLDIPDFIAAELSQPRRMRSKETHYIDHPLFGVIVHAIPLQ